MTLAKQAQLHNNWQGLLARDAGCYMLVGKAGPMWNHWVAYNAWTGILYDGSGVVRIIEESDYASQASAKAVFVDELQLDDLREVYVVKRKKDQKNKTRSRGKKAPVESPVFLYTKTEQDKDFRHGEITWEWSQRADGARIWGFRSALIFGEIYCGTEDEYRLAKETWLERVHIVVGDNASGSGGGSGSGSGSGSRTWSEAFEAEAEVTITLTLTPTLTQTPIGG